MPKVEQWMRDAAEEYIDNGRDCKGDTRCAECEELVRELVETIASHSPEDPAQPPAKFVEKTNKAGDLIAVRVTESSTPTTTLPQCPNCGATDKANRKVEPCKNSWHDNP